MVSEHVLSGLGGLSIGSGVSAVIAEAAIGPDSTITLGMVVGICGGIIWLNVTLTRIQNRLKNIEAVKHETWTYNRQRAWALELQNKNYGKLDVPIPPEMVPAEHKE